MLSFFVHFQPPHSAAWLLNTLPCVRSLEQHQLHDRQHGHGHAKCRNGRLPYLCSVLAFLMVPKMHHCMQSMRRELQRALLCIVQGTQGDCWAQGCSTSRLSLQCHCVGHSLKLVKLIWVVCACRVPARHDAAAHQILRGDVAAVHCAGRGLGGLVCALLEGGLHAAALHQRCAGAGHDGDEHLVSCAVITEAIACPSALS